MKYLPYTLLAVFSIPLFFINIHSLHGWGDDFAQYIKQAINIVSGASYYKSNYIYNPNHLDYGPPQYPPGFSMLLAPVVAIWGLSFKYMLYLISACLAGMLFSLFAYYRKYTNDVTAVCMSLLCVYAGSVVEFKNQVLSDIPCWFFITVYFAVRKSDYFSTRRTLFLVLIATTVLLIRSQAISLLAAEGIYLLVTTILTFLRMGKLNIRAVFNSVSFKVPAFSILLYALLSQTVFRTPNSTLSFYSQLLGYHGQESFWASFAGNVAYLYELLVHVFHYYPGNPLLSTAASIAVHLLLSCALLGYIITVRKKRDISHIYVLIVSLSATILYQRQGPRLILYLLPFLLLYAHRAMHAYLPRCSV